MGWGEQMPVDVDVDHLLAEHRAACEEIKRLRAERDDLDRRLGEAIEALRPLAASADISPVLRAMEVLR